MPIVETITTAFTAPGARVLLLCTPASAAADSGVGSDVGTGTGGASVTAAREAVSALDRTVETLALDAHPDTTSVTPPRPFWADLVTDSVAPSAGSSMVPLSAPSAVDNSVEKVGSSASQRADLVLAALPADAAGVVSLDRLALTAAQRLRFGGTLAVYTHSDCNQGRLIDPTGPIVAAGQHADLLYLQHIITLHTPIRDGSLHAAPTPAAADEYDRVRRRATERGLPAPHLRAHGDVLVFAQPRDHGPPPPQPPATPPAAHSAQPGRGERR